jgi:CheY-like chemotaxis protein
MKILVVDDYEEKLNEIEKFLLSEFSNIQVSKTRSYQSGLKEILTKEFNLILLDMSMPTYDISKGEKGGQKKPFAGKEILRQMQRKNISVPVIIITQFKTFGESPKSLSLQELNIELNQFKNYIDTVFYVYGNIAWNKDLKRIIDEL